MVIIRVGNRVRFITAKQARISFASLIKRANDDNTVFIICKRGKIAAVIGSFAPDQLHLYHIDYIRWRREQKAAHKPVAYNKTT